MWVFQDSNNPHSLVAREQDNQDSPLLFCSPFHCHIVWAAQIIWNGLNCLQFHPNQFCWTLIGTKKINLKKNWVDNVWIDKNWHFKQNVQIELIKIENSNKTFKLNWKKLKIQTKYSNWIEKNWKFKQDIQTELKKIENSNNIIKLNWKKFELQIYGSVWFEIIWSFSQYMTKLIWIELNVESLIWAALDIEEGHFWKVRNTCMLLCL